jgi:hypothetical protein
MKEAEPKAIMLSIVADYDRLAQWAEKSLSGRTSFAGPELTRGGRGDMKDRLTFARTEKHLKWGSVTRSFFGKWRQREKRMRLGIYLAIIGLVVPMMASAQQFHPSMVQVGEVSPQEPHVTFDPPFPSTPKVVLSIKDQSVGGTYRGCGVEAKNITATGFDYFPACSARRPGGPLPVPLNLIAIWIATVQQ